MISACAFNQDTRFSFSFSKIEQSVRKACFFLFIFFHRTTFGVAKASVCFREAATKKKCYETGQIHSKKVRAFNYRATVTAKNQTVKMTINNMFGLQKNHLKDSLYQNIKFI